MSTNPNDLMQELRTGLEVAGLLPEQIDETIRVLGIGSLGQLKAMKPDSISSALKPGPAGLIIDHYFPPAKASDLGAPTIDDLKGDSSLAAQAAAIAHVESAGEFLRLIVTGNFENLASAFGLESCVELYAPVPMNIGWKLLAAAMQQHANRACIAFVPDEFAPIGLPVVAVPETIQVITNMLEGASQPDFMMVNGQKVMLYKLGQNPAKREVYDPLCWGELKVPFMLNGRSTRFIEINYAGIRMEALQFIALATEGGEFTPSVRTERREIITLAREGLDALMSEYPATAFTFKRKREDQQLPALTKRLYEGGDSSSSGHSFRG